MDAGVDDTVGFVAVRQKRPVGEVVAESEEQDAHTGKTMVPDHLTNICRNGSQVFGDYRQPPEPFDQPVKKSFGRYRDPMARGGRLGLGRYFPVGHQPAEVVDAGNVIQSQMILQALYPPVEARLLQRLPVVNGMSPELPGGTEIVWRDAGNGRNRLEILCFGDQQERRPDFRVKGITPAGASALQGLGHSNLLADLSRNLVMAGSSDTAEILHGHTWYTYLAGCLIKQLLQIPLVVTTHSLEPHRPWKKEQLGNGYFTSGWLEKTALGQADGIIAVSQAMQTDILDLYDISADKVHVIHNGINADRYRKTHDTGVLAQYGIDANRPVVLFVGRITRQKGILHLLRALHHVKNDFQLVLCAGAADTEEIAGQVEKAVAAVRSAGTIPVIWIREMVPIDCLIVLYSQAAVFVCPSVYEPFGIINLEAMACGTPVVASPKRRAAMGTAARRRVEARFSWRQIARRTLAVYGKVAGNCCVP